MSLSVLMAIIKEMVGKKVIDGFRGVVDFYYYMGVSCARSWPKSPGKSRSWAVTQQWAVFKEAARLWPLLSTSVQQTYVEMARPTNLTGKDMFFRGYISGTLRYYAPPDALEG